MLGKRIFFAILLLVPIVALLTADYAFNGGVPGIWLFPVGSLVAALAAHELHFMTRAWQPPVVIVVGATTLVCVLSGTPLVWAMAGEPYPADCPVGRLGWTTIGLALAAGLVFADALRRFGRAASETPALQAPTPHAPAPQGLPGDTAGGPFPGRLVVQTAMALWVVLYIGALFSFLVHLRLLGDNPRGMTALVSLIFVVKMSDVGAYTCGKLLGRNKLAPRLSPGKTIEGAVGGILTACGTAALYFAWIGPLFFPATQDMPVGSWWGWLLYGGLLAGAGIFGDLSESFVKRDSGVKDSSTWLPGLGGMLDLVDSLLFAAPMAYACWISGMLG